MGKKSKNKFKPISVKEEKEMDTEMEKKDVNVNVEPEVNVEEQTSVQESEGVLTPELPENSEEVTATTVETVIEETESTDEPNEEPVKVSGKLLDCTKLYIRKEASKESESVAILTEDDTVLIDLTESTEEFYKVTFNEISGYCVKKFIQEITE